MKLLMLWLSLMPGRLVLLLLALGMWIALLFFRNRKLSTLWWRTALGLCLLMTGLVMLSCFAFRPSKDLNLARLMTQFEVLAHPSDSVLIQRFFNFGILEGNGNHCDYFVAQLRRSDLSDQALNAYYQKLNLQTAESRNGQVNQSFLHPTVQVAERKPTTSSILIETRSNEGLGLPHIVRESLMESSKIPPPSGSGQLYLVFVLDGGYPATDLRCH